MSFARFWTNSRANCRKNTSIVSLSVRIVGQRCRPTGALHRTKEKAPRPYAGGPHSHEHNRDMSNNRLLFIQRRHGGQEAGKYPAARIHPRPVAAFVVHEAWLAGIHL